jgi:hypothetical protein
LKYLSQEEGNLKKRNGDYCMGGLRLLKLTRGGRRYKEAKMQRYKEQKGQIGWV